jgi:hypothetical protein
LPTSWSKLSRARGTTDLGKFLPGNAGLAVFSVRPNADRLSSRRAFVALVVWPVAGFVLATIALTRRDA